jgi:hypothetical protein
MPSKKSILLALAAFTAVLMMLMMVFSGVASAIGEGLGEALQSAAEFTGTDDDVREILDRITSTKETTQGPNLS